MQIHHAPTFVTAARLARRGKQHPFAVTRLIAAGELVPDAFLEFSDGKPPKALFLLEKTRPVLNPTTPAKLS